MTLINGNLIDILYPVGSLYMSTNNTLPSELTADGRTWSMLSGDYVLKTISSGTGGTTSSAGSTGSTTLTAAQSGVPAHSHGLNSHTHNIPALSGTAASAGAHYHTANKYDAVYITNDQLSVGNGHTLYNIVYLAGSSIHSICTESAGAHTHSVTTSASTTGQATGSTANNGAANASSGHTHTAGMPQNIGVYVWKRIA